MAEIKYSVVTGDIITWEKTSSLRWVYPNPNNKNNRVLEQEWINRSTGDTEWREITGQL